MSHLARAPIPRATVRAAIGAAVACAVAWAWPASANPVNLRWNACWGDGGATNRTFACDTNLGSELLVASFVLPAAVDGVTGVELVFDVSTLSGTTGTWWTFDGAGACRPSSLSVSANPPAGASACVDWAQGTTNAYWTWQTFGPGVYQLHVSNPLGPGFPFDLVAGQEYFAAAIRINHTNTVGSGACPGCTVGACIGIRSAHLHRSSGDYVIDFTATPGAIWQQWNSPRCSFFTSTQRLNWGALRSLYR